MPRRTSFSSMLNQMAREAARRQREYEKRLRAEARAAAAAETAARKAALSAAKDARERYVASRVREVEDLNEELRQRVDELNSVLTHTLSINDAIDFESLRIREAFRPFEPPAHLLHRLIPPSREAEINSVKRPSGLSRLVPGAGGRYRRELAEAERRHSSALEVHEQAVAAQQAELAAHRERYDAEVQAFQAKVQERDQQVDELQALYLAGDPDAVVAYNSMVLERSEYPEGFPQEFRVAYVAESRELVIDYELPGPAIIPDVAEYSYAKARDEVTRKARRPAEVKEMYQDVVAAVCLRTCHEVLAADQATAVDVVAFSGFVQAVDPATGQDIRPCLISVRVTKDRFAPLDLSRIDKAACLRNLGAQVSPRPHEVQPVKPIVEFDMVDRRYVEQSDVLADLDSRQNLMDLTPFEFEHLIANLFREIGLETRLTRSSRDGGVDVVAYDARPVLGGKVVIQAKRWRNTVGVSAVRDLYGTMMNEGANKGILVTTSGYGPDAFDFARDKPIELMDGGQLLYMLEQAGVKAKIIFPEDSA